MTKKDVYEFLISMPVMSAAINGDPLPVSTMLLFHAEPDLTMYFVTRSNSFKAKALIKDPKMSYSLWQDKKMLVQGTGTTEIISDKERIEWVMDRLVVSLATVGDFWPPVLQIEGTNYQVYKFTPSWVRVLKLKEPSIKAKDEAEMFEEIKL